MSRIDLPYYLQDGQKAYAGKLMANLEAIANKINSVEVTGMGSWDVETVLNRFKVLLDQECAGADRVVENFSYDQESRELRLKLGNGAYYVVDLSTVIPNYTGSEGEEITLSVQGDGVIRGTLEDGAISQDKLNTALQQLIAGKVSANSPGNAAEIFFSDGESFQQKLEQGAFKGADGVSATLAGIYYFRVDAADGHLYVGVADGSPKPPLSINEQGHLIYTID